ncbi:hypothetical protein J7I98_05375 [Streptomyces sp. ISL-98]|uniref:hypothetical protein n=1 Tax=Streptomyces sp. ISL-98 TaxID=2819192 RepID=UPI001BE7F73E|nr:hypothetical protein [Streptomyces sp. ISL-98]MBT2505338.1 hypothetical protein [Streptomyces sp. ISL-98]
MTTNDAITTDAPAAAPTPAAPSVRSAKDVRVAAGIGLVLLVADLVLCLVLTLADAMQGKGIGGPLIDAGFAVLYPAGVAGLAALFAPKSWLVKAQYVLLVLAPLLILLDGSS